MVDEKTDKPYELSPLERKIATYCCIALASAAIGFGVGVAYGHWMAQPISVMEQKLNDDQYLDLSITNRGLDRTEYLGGPGGSYHHQFE